MESLIDLPMLPNTTIPSLFTSLFRLWLEILDFLDSRLVKWLRLLADLADYSPRATKLSQRNLLPSGAGKGE